MALHPSILKTLLRGPASIAELQPIVQVSLPTLRKALQELTETRWIQVVGQADTNGGRPAKLFGLDDRFYLLVGVHVQLPGLRLVASDLTGAVQDVAVDFANTVPSPEEAMQRIVDYVAHIRQQFPERMVLGVGLASPGFTDPATGTILSIGRVAGWHDFPICQRLSDTLQMPVTIANDVDCMAFAEFQHTGASFEKNLAYIGFDEGVKVSLFLNGELYKGSFGNAGLIVTDLLHLEHEFAATQRSQILTIPGINRLFDEQLAALPPQQHAPYATIVGTQNLRERFQLILEGAVDGLPLCERIVQFLTAALAAATANTLYLIQPDKLVIGGVLSTMPPALYTALVTAIRAHLPPLFSRHTRIEQATLSSPNRAALGASYHFLQSYLSEAALGSLSPS